MIILLKFQTIRHIMNYLVAISIRTSGFILRRFQIESWSFIRFCVPVSPRRPKETKTTTYDKYDNGFISKLGVNWSQNEDDNYILTCDLPRLSPFSISLLLLSAILDATVGMDMAGSMSFPPNVGAKELIVAKFSISR